MSINSLLEMLKTDVPDVPGVPASNDAGFGGTAGIWPDVPGVPASSTATFGGTAGTASVPSDVPDKASKNNALPSGTPGTVQNNNSELKTNQERAIRRWLAAIGETDELQVAEVIDRCGTDPEVLRYFLGRATQEVTCGHCGHFQPVEDHPHLGRCANGQAEAVAGRWDIDRKVCLNFQFCGVTK